MYQELGNDERRQSINVRQIYEALEDCRVEYDRRFKGSMRWVERNGCLYLLRKVGRSEVSLGRESEKTKSQFVAFQEGREKTRERMAGMKNQLDRFAPINRAYRLNRVPALTARILRRLAESRLLGNNVFVVGTNALFAYEAMAGVQFGGELLATGDMDLLFDARRGLRLVAEDVRAEGMLRTLQRIDRSFEPRGRGDYRAVNKEGFYVDFVMPDQGMDGGKNKRILPADDELFPVGIGGLKWLINAPKSDAGVIGEDGMPLRMWTIDPRVFALHKLWLSRRMNREPVRRQRDEAQARAVAEIAIKFLGLDLSSSELSALPAEMRGAAERLEQIVESADAGTGTV